jgi:hypothetical protein
MQGKEGEGNVERDEPERDETRRSELARPGLVCGRG